MTRPPPTPAPPTTTPRRKWLLPVAAGVAFVALVAAAGFYIRWVRERTFDRHCAEVATWVKAGYAGPGAYPGLTLPAGLGSMSADGKVDAAVLPGGRVVLLMRTTLGWHGNWSGVVYTTAPLTPAEIGVDAYGRPQIRVGGLPEHFVTRQVDGQHYEVAFDLG